MISGEELWRWMTAEPREPADGPSGDICSSLDQAKAALGASGRRTGKGRGGSVRYHGKWTKSSGRLLQLMTRAQFGQKGLRLSHRDRGHDLFITICQIRFREQF